MKTKFKYKEKVIVFLPDNQTVLGIVDGYDLFMHKYIVFCGDQIGTEYFTTKELLRIDSERGVEE